METWHYWIIIGIILMILEIFTPGFLLASFGIGAIVSSIASYLGIDFKYQLLTFAISTMAVFLGIRPAYKKFFGRFDDSRKTGIDDLKGKKFVVSETVSNKKNTGQLKIYGERWRALSDTGEDIEAGEIAIVKRIEGTTVYIVKAEPLN